jgi:CheY-like chemotaxis protein
MPEMDGVTATRYIRAFEQGDAQDMPPLAGLEEKLAGKLSGRHQFIAAVTAHALDNDREQYLAAGMDAYLTKPYKCEDLERVFQEYIHTIRFPVLTECRSIVKEESQESMISEEDVDRVRTHLGKCYGLSSDDAEIVLSTYIQTIRQTLARFEKALLERCCVVACSQAHSLKGALLNLGLDEQASAASVLEKRCRENLDGDTLAGADKLVRRLSLMLKFFSSKKEQR